MYDVQEKALELLKKQGMKTENFKIQPCFFSSVFPGQQVIMNLDFKDSDCAKVIRALSEIGFDNFSLHQMSIQGNDSPTGEKKVEITYGVKLKKGTAAIIELPKEEPEPEPKQEPVMVAPYEEKKEETVKKKVLRKEVKNGKNTINGSDYGF